MILHYALPSPLTAALREHRGRRVLLHHNITPPEFFVGLRPRDGAHLRARPRGAARAWPSTWTWGWPTASSTAAELEAAGFRRTGVLPIYLDFARYREAPSPVLARACSATAARNVLFVGRVAAQQAPRGPHPPGRLLEAVHLARRAPAAGGQAAAAAPLLRRPAGPRVRGGLHAGGGGLHRPRGPRRPAGLLRAPPHVFVSMSEHEGFGVPLVEAMLMDVPVAGLSRHRGARHAGRRRRAVRREAAATRWRRWRTCSPPTTALRARGAGRPAAAPAGLRAGGGGGARCRRLPGRAVSEPRARLRRPALRRGRHRRLRVAGARGGRAAGRGACASPCFTTCARDYVTWRNELPAGAERLNGVDVRALPGGGGARPRRLQPLLGDALRPAALARRTSWSGCAGRARTRRGLVRGPREAQGRASTPSSSSPTCTTRRTAACRRRPSARCWCPPPTTSRRCASASTTTCSRCRARSPSARSRSASWCARASALATGPRGRDRHRRRDRRPRPDVDGFRIRHDVRGPYVLYAGRIDAGKGCAEMVALLRPLPARLPRARRSCSSSGTLAMEAPRVPGRALPRLPLRGGEAGGPGRRARGRLPQPVREPVHRPARRPSRWARPAWPTRAPRC